MGYVDTHPLYCEMEIDAHLRLVEPEIRHASASISWIQIPEVVQYMGADFSNPSLEGEVRRIEDIRSTADTYSWMIECDGVAIGNIAIHSIEEQTKKHGVKAGMLTILIGMKDA